MKQTSHLFGVSYKLLFKKGPINQRLNSLLVISLQSFNSQPKLTSLKSRQRLSVKLRKRSGHRLKIRFSHTHFTSRRHYSHPHQKPLFAHFLFHSRIYILINRQLWCITHPSGSRLTSYHSFFLCLNVLLVS